MPSAGIEPATYRSSVRKSSELGSNSENNNNLGLNPINSQNNGKPNDRDFPDIKSSYINNEGKEIRGIPGCSVAEWFGKNGRAEDFDKFHNENKRKRDKNTKSYINVLLKMDDIVVPNDWVGKNVSSTTRNAFNAFLNYFNSLYFTDKKFNGYGTNDWAVGKKRTTNNRGTRVASVIKDATPKEALYHFNHAIDAPVEEKKKACQVFYLMLLYTGARISQLWQFFEDLAYDNKVYDPNTATEKHVSELYEDVGSCFRYNVRYIGYDKFKGNDSSKQTTYYYFPNLLKAAVKNYRNPYSYQQMCNKLGVKLSENDSEDDDI